MSEDNPDNPDHPDNPADSDSPSWIRPDSAGPPLAANPDRSATNPRGAGTKRKRGPALSSRSVAALTPEQLEKKRKNDREAQRAIRERTKAHIDRLNDRIREFEQSDAQQLLDAARRAKAKADDENGELKKKMAAAIALLQPHVNPTPSPLSIHPLPTTPTPSASTSSATVPAPPPQFLPQRPPTLHPHSGIAHSLPPIQGPPYVPASIPAIHSPVTYAMSPASHGSAPRSVSATPVLGNAHLSHASTPSQDYGTPKAPGGELYQPGYEHEETGFVIESQSPAFVRVPHSFEPVDNPPPPAPTPPVHAILPKVYKACLLDNIMLDYLYKSQRAAARGESLLKWAGPRHPSFNVLVKPFPHYDPHPLSKLFTDILKTFPDITELPDKVAVVYIMFLVLRWQVQPTLENYLDLPEWMTPRPPQLFHTHPSWLDHLPWPRLRDATCQMHPAPNFNNFFVPYTTTFSVNWKGSPAECLIQVEPDPSPTNHPQDGKWIISPKFEAHIRQLANWSLGQAFADEFPEWKDFVRIKSNPKY